MEYIIVLLNLQPERMIWAKTTEANIPRVDLIPIIRATDPLSKRIRNRAIGFNSMYWSLCPILMDI